MFPDESMEITLPFASVCVAALVPVVLIGGEITVPLGKVTFADEFPEVTASFNPEPSRVVSDPSGGGSHQSAVQPVAPVEV
jgi:hypothetical protein